MPDARPSPTDPRTERWTLVLASIASLMVALDVLVVSTALGTIRQHLGASLSELEWTVNAYSLSFAVLLITASALGDRLGRRRLFAAGLGLFTVSSALCAVAPNVGLLIAARALQGVGAAIIAPLSLSLLTAVVPAQRRGTALGIYGGITGLAVLGGPVLGGAVTQGLAWPFIFWLNVPIGLIAIPLVLTRLPESYGPRARADLPGLALVSAAMLGLIWGLIRSNRVGWASAETLVTLGGGLLLTAAFIAVQRRTAEPMLPLRLFRQRAFAAGGAANLLLAGSLFGAVFFMAQFQQLTLHQGPLAAGVRLLPWTGVVFLIAPVAGAMIGRVGERVLVASGLFLHASAMLWIALVARAGVPYGELVAPMVISGIGLSLSIPAAQNAMVGAASPDDAGRAAGVYTMLRQLGAALGIAVIVAVFAGAGGYASAQVFSNGFVPAIAVSAGFGFAAAAAGALLPARPGRRAYSWKSGRLPRAKSARPLGSSQSS